MKCEKCKHEAHEGQCRHHIWKVAGGKHYASVSERCECGKKDDPKK